MGKKGRKKGKKRPADSAEVDSASSMPSPDEVVSVLASAHSFECESLSADLSPEGMVCIESIVTQALTNEDEAARRANELNALGIGSFFARTERGVVIRTASFCSSIEDERANQVRAMLQTHSTNLFKYRNEFTLASET